MPSLLDGFELAGQAVQLGFDHGLIANPVVAAHVVQGQFRLEPQQVLFHFAGLGQGARAASLAVFKSAAWRRETTFQVPAAKPKKANSSVTPRETSCQGLKLNSTAYLPGPATCRS